MDSVGWRLYDGGVMICGFLLGVRWWGWGGVEQTTHLPLSPRLRMGGTTSPLRHVPS
jgi:hypothetical protein